MDRNQLYRPILIFLFTCGSSPGLLAAPEFIQLQSAEHIWARDISGDGLVVIGERTVDGAYRWTESGGVVPLGIGSQTTAHGVSFDGSVIVGSHLPSGGTSLQPYRWSVLDGLTDLGLNIADAGTALDVSADGLVLVGGISSDVAPPECEPSIAHAATKGFRWSTSDGISLLNTGADFGVATSISADATRIVVNDIILSHCWINFGAPFLDSGSGPQRLPGLQDEDFVTRLSADGETLIGYGSQWEAFRWQNNLGYQGFPTNSGRVARDTSADGRLIVGDFGLWHQGRLVDLKNLLVNGYGLPATGWSFVTDYRDYELMLPQPLFGGYGLTGVSDDGLTWAGTAVSPDNQVKAFIVKVDNLPEQTLMDSLPVVDDYFRVLSAALPLFRSAQVGVETAVYASVSNQSTEITYQGCTVRPFSTQDLSYRVFETDPSTNVMVGGEITSFSLTPLMTKTFVVLLTPTAEFSVTDIQMIYDCGNSARPESLDGLNRVRLTATSTPTPDIVSVATTNTPGVAELTYAPGQLYQLATGMFVVSAYNLGADADAANFGMSADLDRLSATVCVLDGMSQCVEEPTDTVSFMIGADETVQFGVFVEYQGFPVSDAFRSARLTGNFTDGDNNLIGQSSVATQVVF